MEFEEKVNTILGSLGNLLVVKNRNYGNSALVPLNIFSKMNSQEGIMQRLDDKLMRVKNSKELRKNDIADLMGYLTLLSVQQEWLDFTDLID
jgi:hypothetical protein